MNMVLITALVQMITLVLKGWMEFDAEKRKKQNDLREGWKDAVKSGDIARINSIIDKLRT